MAIKVTCAIIERDKRVLVTQRNEHMSQAMLWEFPGGKIEQGETEQECVERELQEELQIDIKAVQRLAPVTHHYSDKEIMLIPYICRFIGGEISLAEHRAYNWAELQELHSYTWCPADVPVVEQYLAYRAHAASADSD